MVPHRTFRCLLFVRFLCCLLFALSLLGCAAPFEIIPSSSYVPSAAQVEKEAALYAIPPDLRAGLNAAMAQWQARVENVGAERRYVAQMPNPIRTMQQQLLNTVLDWAAGESPDQRLETLEERRRALEESMPLPHLEDPVVQFGGGTVAGGASGAVPLGPMAADVAIELKVLPKGTYWARVGKVCGEFAVGVGQIIVGCGGISGGIGMSSTGGGAVVGAPLIAASFAIAVNGGLTVISAFGHAVELREEGPRSEAPAPEPEVKLLQPKPKPAPQAPAAAAPPQAVKPAPPAAKPPQAQLAAPTKTSTTTRNKSTGVIETKTGATTTTTRPKGAPGEQSPIRNAHLAGKVHPKTKVPFDRDGYPDFKAAGVVKKEVKIKFSGDRPKDVRAANKTAGLTNTPEGHTWHHHQDGTTMQLVPTTIHEQTGHTGGFASSR